MITYWFNRLADVLDEEAAIIAGAVERVESERDRAVVAMMFGTLAVVLRKVGGEER